jgi:hypothetical protein
VLDLLDDLQDALEDLVRGAIGVVGADEEDHGFEFDVEVEFAVLDSPEDVFDPVAADSEVDAVQGAYLFLPQSGEL